MLFRSLFEGFVDPSYIPACEIHLELFWDPAFRPEERGVLLEDLLRSGNTSLSDSSEVLVCPSIKRTLEASFEGLETGVQWGIGR